MGTHRLLMLLFVVLALMCFTARAGAEGDASLAAKSQNPVGNIISIPMENNTYFEVGPAEE
jgi:hypothetical protein